MTCYSISATTVVLAANSWLSTPCRCCDSPDPVPERRPAVSFSGLEIWEVVEEVRSELGWADAEPTTPPRPDPIGRGARGCRPGVSCGARPQRRPDQAHCSASQHSEPRPCGRAMDLVILEQFSRKFCAGSCTESRNSLKALQDNRFRFCLTLRTVPTSGSQDVSLSGRRTNGSKTRKKQHITRREASRLGHPANEAVRMMGVSTSTLQRTRLSISGPPPFVRSPAIRSSQSPGGGVALPHDRTYCFECLTTSKGFSQPQRRPERPGRIEYPGPA